MHMELADPTAETDDLLDGQDSAVAQEASEEQKAQAAADLVYALGQELLTEFNKRKTDRLPIEKRWLEDINQYNGIYSDETKQALESRDYGSRVFVPLTRRIMNVVEPKLADLLFPMDDRNFVVSESPEQDLEDALPLAMKLAAGSTVKVGGMTLTAEAVKAALRELREENTKKAQGMQRVIDDQLTESNYASHARAVIHDAMLLGSGVMKGPLVLGKVKKRWIRVNGRMQMQRVESFVPTANRVDPWNYYPDLSVGELEHMSGHFERHPMNKAQLAKLAQQPGFRNIEKIVAAGTTDNQGDGHTAATREAAGTTGVASPAYNLIEYNGPVDHEKLRAWGATNLPEDPLLVYDAIVWFSEVSGEVVKAIVSPMDCDSPPYSIFNWQKDTACVFGYGLPYELRDTQEAGNSVFRALLDNMGLSSGPITVIDDQAVVPADGKWGITPRKAYRLRKPGTSVNNVFGFYQVNSLATELLAVFNSIKTVAEEIGGPAMAMQGNDAPSYLQAGATGVAMAFNAASVWMRRGVRAWDDQVTIPMISRFIDWNMQYHDDDSIKGDLKAVARGTSALLEAEGYAAKLQVLAKLSAEAGVPIRKIVNQLKKIAVAMRMDPDELLPDDAEVKQMEEERRKNGPPPNPELERIKLREAEISDNKEQRAHEMRLKEMENEMRWAELASNEGLTREEARLRYGTELKKTAAQIAADERREETENQRFNAELAAKGTYGSGI